MESAARRGMAPLGAEYAARRERISELHARLSCSAKSHKEGAADRDRKPPHQSSLFDVGGNLDACHAIGIGRRLTAFELVNYVHSLDHLADHGVLAVEE